MCAWTSCSLRQRGGEDALDAVSEGSCENDDDGDDGGGGEMNEAGEVVKKDGGKRFTEPGGDEIQSIGGGEEWEENRSSSSATIIDRWLSSWTGFSSSLQELVFSCCSPSLFQTAKCPCSVPACVSCRVVCHEHQSA